MNRCSPRSRCYATYPYPGFSPSSLAYIQMSLYLDQFQALGVYVRYGYVIPRNRRSQNKRGRSKGPPAIYQFMHRASQRVRRGITIWVRMPGVHSQIVFWWQSNSKRQMFGNRAHYEKKGFFTTRTANIFTQRFMSWFIFNNKMHKWYLIEKEIMNGDVQFL